MCEIDGRREKLEKQLRRIINGVGIFCLVSFLVSWMLPMTPESMLDYCLMYLTFMPLPLAFIILVLWFVVWRKKGRHTPFGIWLIGTYFILWIASFALIAFG